MNSCTKSQRNVLSNELDFKEDEEEIQSEELCEGGEE